LSGKVSDTAEERLNLYNAFKAVTGLGDPVNPKSVEKQVKGFLHQVLGSSPKHNFMQQKLLATPVNTVGRGVITPNADLTMDEVGVPENQAWTVYAPHVIRNLVRRGVPRHDALTYLEKKAPIAREALVKELEASPVLVTRAPVLHKYGHMAMWPKLMKGDAIHLPPPVYKGYGADNDGDQMNWHLPVSPEARSEAVAKMLPSKNLRDVSDFSSPMYGPSQEFSAGMWELTKGKKSGRAPRVFHTMADLRRAWARGELHPSDEVHILDEKG
jgi:DNA-directed RNA polymerase subunit beta'